MTAERVLRHLRSSLWFVPVVCVLFGATLSFVTVAVDRASDYDLISERVTGGPDAALAILSTIAASMVSLAALVLTITMVVVQLAMGQFSPRIVQTILRDKPSQFAIGLFVATFVHAMLGLREVRPGQDPVVPGLTIVFAYVLVVVSVAVLVVYVHHIGRSLRVSALIELVGTDTRRLLDRLYPDRRPAAEADDVIVAPVSGVVTGIGHAHLVRVAEEHDCVLELVPPMGAFVPAGAPLFHVEGANGAPPVNRVKKGVVLSLERTLDEDIAYGLRLLVDVAVRSLADSPFLDPTTAVQAIDRIHDCLRQLGCRVFPDGRYRDEHGVVRLVITTMSWSAYVHLAFDEIRLAGAGSPQVSRRLVAAFDDLEAVVPPERRAAIREQRQLLQNAVRRAFEDDIDLREGMVADRQGIGAASGGEVS
jgi:uncharacterized membrane protein